MQGAMQLPPMHPEVVRLQSRAFEHRVRITAALADAGINRRLWQMWKAGVTPRDETLDNLDQAITALMEEAS